jgi:hypothetical protein
MSPVLTRHAPEPVLRVRTLAVPVFAVVASVALFFGLLRFVEPSDTVDAVTIDNRTSYGLDVDVADRDGGARLLLAAVDPDASTRIHDVLDQGDTWQFRVERAGTHIGTIERSRDQLSADGWRVVVPASWDVRVQEAAANG